MDRALHVIGVKGDTGAAGKSAVEKLLGGDTAKATARTDSAKTDTTRVAGGPILASLVQSAGAASGSAVPGEYIVPETAFPRVDSLLSLPAVARQLASRRRRYVGLGADERGRPVGSIPLRARGPADHHRQQSRSMPRRSSTRSPTDPIVTFELDRAGGRKFGDETGKHVGDYMAIVLDGRVQGRPPVIQSRIDRNGQITLGDKTLPGSPGPGADPQGGCAADPAQDRRGAAGRRQPGQRLDPRRASRPGSSAPCS